MMGDKRKNLFVAAVTVAGLVVGGVIGYFIGTSVGENRGIVLGRSALLVEQAADEEAMLAEIQKAANPFSEVQNAANPFKDAYTNPFAE